jgi:hypothetical protein
VLRGADRPASFDWAQDRFEAGTTAINAPIMRAPLASLMYMFDLQLQVKR